MDSARSGVDTEGAAWSILISGSQLHPCCPLYGALKVQPVLEASLLPLAGE